MAPRHFLGNRRDRIRHQQIRLAPSPREQPAHRQAVADLVHLCRNAGPEIAITAVVPALAGRLLLRASRTQQVRNGAI
jgi:hypothetical protein